MAKTGLKIEIDKVFREMIKTNKAIKRSATIGIGRSLLQLKTDVVMQRPTAPIKEGFLRGSISIFVQNKPIPIPNLGGENPAHRVNQHTISIKKTEIIGFIGINEPYAAKWHEIPANFTEESAGNKYLESKMVRNKFTYKRIIQKAIIEKAK